MLELKLINRLAAWGLAALSIGILLYCAYGGIANFGQVNDFPEYWTAGKLLKQGQASKIYQIAEFSAVQHQHFPSLGNRTVVLFIPPFAVPFLLPLVLIPITMAPICWAVLLFTALIGCVFLLVKTYPQVRERLPLLIACLAFSAPAAESLRLGQWAPIFLLALCGAQRLLSTRRTITAGLVLSFLLLKPQLLWPLAIYLLGNRRYKLMATLVVVTLIFGGISILTFGKEGYQQYFNLIGAPASLQFMQPEITPTIRGQLMRILGTASIIPNYVAEACLAASSIYVFMLGRRAADHAQWWEIAMVGAVPIGLLTSLHCHLYDWLVLCPAFVVIMTDASPFGNHPLLKLWVAVSLVIVSELIHIYVHYGYLLPGGTFNCNFWLLLVFSSCTAFITWRICAPRSAISAEE